MHTKALINSAPRALARDCMFCHEVPAARRIPRDQHTRWRDCNRYRLRVHEKKASAANACKDELPGNRVRPCAASRETLPAAVSRSHRNNYTDDSILLVVGQDQLAIFWRDL